jgi:hypothetical protein
MIVTSLEAHVAPDKQDLLQEAFKKQLAGKLAGAKEAVLTRSANDPNLWRLMGFWESREIFESYRRSVPVPAGFLVFRAAGAEPTLNMFEIVDRQKWN